MVREAAARVATNLRERLGDELRTVAVIRENGWETSYLREDLREKYDQETYAAVVDAVRLDRPLPDTGSLPIGERRIVLQHHENALVLQFPVTETETILVSITPEAGRNLVEFIESCRRTIDGTAE